MTTLGSSDLDLFPLVLGGNTFGWTSDDAGSLAVLDTFVERGGTMVDTADVYSVWAPGHSGGESERLIGRWLASHARDSLQVATKVGNHPDFKGLAPANIATAADASLARLGTDYIDLYYAHSDDLDVPIEDIAAAFDALVKAGKVRNVALSNITPERADAWFAAAEANGLVKPVAIQPHYNLLTREPFESQFAPLAARHNIGVLPYFSLAAGMLTGKYRSADDFSDAARAGQLAGYASAEAFAVVDTLVDVATEAGTTATAVALAWLLAKPTVAAPIASASSVSQLDALFAGATLQLSDEQVARLDEASAPLAAAA